MGGGIDKETEDFVRLYISLFATEQKQSSRENMAARVKYHKWLFYTGTLSEWHRTSSESLCSSTPEVRPMWIVALL